MGRNLRVVIGSPPSLNAWRPGLPGRFVDLFGSFSNEDSARLRKLTSHFSYIRICRETVAEEDAMRGGLRSSFSKLVNKTDLF
jgi:hypothetical protein